MTDTTGMASQVADTIVHQDCSTASKVLKPWWNFVGSVMPNFISPNLITFVGGFFMLASVLVSYSTTAAWSLLFHAFAIFVFQTLDAVDGIQARKLKASSKLGNFVDHYTDVFSLQIMFYVMMQSMKISEPLMTFAILFANYNVFLTHWETVFTNLLYFTDGFSITELQLMGIAIHLITYFVPDIWLISFHWFSLSDAFIVGLLGLNTLYVTVPLLKRVTEKRGFDVIWSLIPVTLMTFGLSMITHSSDLTSTLISNLPYTYAIGDLLINFLYKPVEPETLFVTPYVGTVIAFASTNQIIRWAVVLVLLSSVIYQYFTTIQKMSEEFGIPIIGVPIIETPIIEVQSETIKDGKDA